MNFKFSLNTSTSMEELLLNVGFSHTLSKVTPYLIVILLGILMMRFIFGSFFLKNKTVKWAVAFLLLLAPFFGYFAVNPIYEGDFSQNGKQIKVRNVITTKIENGLLVLTIPGCPYCFESIASLKQLKKRNPDLKILLAVTATEDENDLMEYKKEVNGAFRVELMTNTIALVAETGGFFPSFVLVNDGIADYVWTNDQFGVRAKDRVENWKRKV